MNKPGASMLVLGFAAIAAVAAGWYALAPHSPAPILTTSTDSNGQPVGIEPSADPRSLDRSVFDVVLWYEPPPPPVPEIEPTTALVRKVPPPQLELLAIARTSIGYEAVFYDKQADRLVVMRESDELGPYRITGIGSTWAKLDHAGRETTFRLDQPRIAAREAANKAALRRPPADD